MSLTTYLHKRLVDLLDDRRVVVWYDSERVFSGVARSFAAPNCSVIQADDSRLRARRQADEVLCQLNDSSQPSQARNGTLFIYCGWARGRTVEERLQDPFEGFARIGVAFGDKEAETFQSLARQAMPERGREINRLFAEGRPTVPLIEGLGDSVRYPLLQAAFGTDSLTEVVAELLCLPDHARKLSNVAGAKTELLRLLQDGLGFSAPPQALASESILEHLGRYVLFSEFVLDAPAAVPEQLTGVPRAPDEYRDAICSLCDRMRLSDDTRDGYIVLAIGVEVALRLPDLVPDLPERCTQITFPFQEKACLEKVQSLAKAGRLTEIRPLFEQQQRSVWRYIPERAILWKLAERCVDFLGAVASWRNGMFRTDATVRDLVQAYTVAEGPWQTDRQQRLVEQGAAACAENEEVAGLVAVCRKHYIEVVEAAQAIFLSAVEREGWPPEGVPRQTQIFDRYVGSAVDERRKTVYFLVDSMRYEMGRDLGTVLDTYGPVTVTSAATILPTTTPCGMAALMPGGDGVYTLVVDGDELTPAVAGRLLRTSADRMALLHERYGDRFREFTLGDVLSMPQKRLQAAVGSADLLIVRTQEIDALGEGPSLFLARKVMSDIIGEVRAATDRLIGLGFQTAVYAADHGHILLADVTPGSVRQKPPGEWKMATRRSLLGSSIARVPGVVVFSAAAMGIVGPAEEFVVPVGLGTFIGGQGYFHEGLSLQESVVPVVVLQARGHTLVGTGVHEVEIRYRSDRFTTRVIGVRVWFNALFPEPLMVRVSAYDGTGPRAKVVGEIADCDARDSATGLVMLQPGKETPIPIRVHDDFTGPIVEIRVVDPTTGAIFHRLKLRNAAME